MSETAQTPQTIGQAVESRVHNLPANVADVLSGRASPDTLSATARPEAKAEATPETPKPANDGQPVPEKGKPDGAVPEVKAEELEARLFGQETPEQKYEKAMRDYKASSKEAQRLKKQADAFREMAAAQGLEVVEEDGVPVALAPGKGYSKDAAAFAPKFKDLPEEVQALAAEDPQKFIDHIAKEARKSLVRVSPTIDKAIRPVTDERKALAIEAVKSMKEMDGEATHGELTKNLPIVERFLKERPALRDLFNQDPELAIALVSDHVSAHRARILAYAKRAESKAATKPSPDISPAGGAKATSNEPGSYAERMGKAIAAQRV